MEFWSPRDPDERDGRFGRIVALHFSGLPGIQEFVINTELVFRDLESDTDEERTQAVTWELAPLFEDSGFKLVRAS